MNADRWLAFHIHYHESFDRVLNGLVRPMLGPLFREQCIDRFFFVRYALGGPHIRLRIRLPIDRKESHDRTPGNAVRDALHERCAAFFAQNPSTRSMSEEQIRRINESVLRTDPGESDDTIHPDNIVREVRFRPEIERYGGPSFIDPSLDYFALSSVQALSFVASHKGQPRARQLPMIFRMLFREARGFAGSVEALGALFDDTVRAAGPSPLVERGDQLFERERDLFARLLDAELRASRDDEEAAALLVCALSELAPATRQGIAISHMHMSANRLGLSNPEEVYIARLLWRAVHECDQDALSAQLDEPLTHEPADATSRLRSMTERILAKSTSHHDLAPDSPSRDG